MSCYFRQLRPIFEEAGIEVTTKNRRQIDQAIHAMMGVSPKHCPTTWKAVKARIATEEGRRAFVEQLAAATVGTSA